MNNAVVTSFGTQPTVEQAKEAVLRSAKEHEELMNNEEPAEEWEPQSLEEALLGEWLERGHLRVGPPFLLALSPYEDTLLPHVWWRNTNIKKLNISKTF